MSDEIAGYVFTSDRQAVVDAVVGVIPQDQWRHLPQTTKLLLVVVLVHRNKQRYCDAAGFLTLTLPDLLRVLRLIDVASRAIPIREAMMSKKLYEHNGKVGPRRRLKFLVTSAVQECLDDLARHDKFEQAFPNQTGLQERSLQLMGELGEDGAAALIYALRGRMTSCVPSR